MAIEDYFAQQANNATAQPASSSGNVWLDLLDKAASWDILRRQGLPSTVDGGPLPVSDIEQQNAARTPPAPAGGYTGIPVTGTQVAIGAGALLAVVALVWALKS